MIPQHMILKIGYNRLKVYDQHFPFVWFLCFASGGVQLQLQLGLAGLF